MILIVGLGNPGKKYQKTRHNLGFEVIEAFRRKNNFPDFKLIKKHKAEVSKGSFNNQKIVLAKPQTLMNLSGKSVKLLIKKYLKKGGCKIKAVAMILEQREKLRVIHDDIDLPLGKIRISIGRGAAGHKGVKSIIRAIRTKNFVRFRIGICPKEGKPKNVEKFVLQKFNKKEKKIFKKIIKKTVEAIELSLREGIEKAMQKFNK